MNEKCKYCDYVSKCSRKCEYGSILCTINRSFPKIVDKSYEELQQENQQLKEQNECLLNQKKDFEYIQTKILDDMDKKNKQLKQKDEVIDEAIQLLEYYYIGNLKYSKDSQIAFRRLSSILWRYKGDNK